MTREGRELRIVCYTNPVSGPRFEFLTHALELPPGVIVELYQRQWAAEKGFAAIKNKLGEKKAWATRLEVKEAPALLIASTHNLRVRYEAELERSPGVTNEAEDRRRAKRTAAAGQACRKRERRQLRWCGKRAAPRSAA